MNKNKNKIINIVINIVFYVILIEKSVNINFIIFYYYLINEIIMYVGNLYINILK